jgi:hypothetical protein
VVVIVEGQQETTLRDAARAQFPCVWGRDAGCRVFKLEGPPDELACGPLPVLGPAEEVSFDDV